MGNPRGRPRIPTARPSWFDLSHYAAAKDMDAAGWYLNLGVRKCLSDASKLGAEETAQWKARESRFPPDMHGNGKEWIGVLCGYIRSSQPLLHASTHTVVDAMEHAKFVDPLWCPDEVDRLLRGDPPPCRVKPLLTSELYYFERQLPQDVRDAGAQSTFPPGMYWRPPPGKSSDLDEQFLKPYTSRFVTVSVRAPDSVLVEEFKHWLADQRRRLGNIPGSENHPYRQSLQALRGRKAPKLRTFGTLGVLPYLDLVQWQGETKAMLTNEGMAELLGIESNRLAETGKYAELLMAPFVLDGWLGPAVRKAGEAQSTGK